MFKDIFLFFNNIVPMIISTNRKIKSRVVRIKKIQNYFKLLTKPDDKITFLLPAKEDYTKIYNFEISLNDNNEYKITWIEDYKYWILISSETKLMELLTKNTLYNIIKYPTKYGFIKQIGLEVSCCNKPDFIAKDIEQIVECIKSLILDDIIYIYDFDTNMRFTIEIYEEKYSFGVLAYYRAFEKDELIEFLYKEDLEIFTKLNDEPEKFGFEFEDDGGM